MSKCKTTFLKRAVDGDITSCAFGLIDSNTTWTEAPRSKLGRTRQGGQVRMDSFIGEFILNLVMGVMKKMSTQNYIIHGIYLSKYKDGRDWTPNHSHKGTHQLVISLGETRTLFVSKKPYPMEDGDAVLFGSAIHGIPKSDSSGVRISIATFMSPV